MKKIISETFQKQHIHFLVILACVVMQIFTIGEGYRVFAYLNLLMVIASCYALVISAGSFHALTWIRGIVFYPVSFALLHWVAQQEIVMLKEMRHILLAVCLAIGVGVLSGKCSQYLKDKLYWIAALVILIYVVVQLVAVFLYGNPYGTTKNPHYLAFYSAANLIVSFFCFFKSTLRFKCFFGALALLLGILLINTGSRPAWLGLLLSAFIVIAFFLDHKVKLRAFLSLVLLLLMLFLTNIGGVTDRTKALIQTVHTEERVTIWKETWDMQMDSSAIEWAVGHGMDTFEENFKPYSTYHLKKVDFNSPHNYFLEMLYLSGFLGLGLFLMMLWSIYQKVISAILFGDENKTIYIMLFSIFNTCFIFASITLPFFNSKSMNIIAYVVGIMFYFDNMNKRKL